MIKIGRKKLSLAVAQALGAGFVVSLAGPLAYAQDAPRIVIESTGTRIKTPGLIANSPVSSVGEEEIKSGQPVAVEQFFKQLPAAVPAIGSATNNGTGGGATIDLRGLGPNRTLVLLDGRRIVPFDLYGTVNTDTIPIALLQRVDLLTGGASAVYGADAISGVVNFILRKDFRGFETSASYGMSEKGDANRWRTDFTIGAGLDGGKGNVAVSFGITKTDALQQSQRKFGEFQLASTNGARSGSGTTVPVQVAGYGQIDPTTGGFKSVSAYNFNPLNYYQTPLDRTQITALGNYLINNHAEVYAMSTFTRADVDSHIAPTGSFLNDYFVPIGNPYLPAAARAAICAGEGLTAAQCANPNTEVLLTLGRRFTELGPRLNLFKNQSYQNTLGLRGDITGSWTYDVYASLGKSDQVQTRGNWGSLSKVQQSLRAIDAATCLDPSNGCVPLNIFGAEGSITPAMLNYINLDAVLGQTVEQRVYSGSVSGDLGSKFKSPWAKDPIGLSFGAEHRWLQAANKSDGPSQVQGEVLGTGAPTPDRSGEFTLREAFIEAIVPVVSGMPGARKLNLEAGYRRSAFSTTSTNTYGSYKYGGEWEPVQDFRVRAMKQRATRAPNINELFQPLTTGLSNLGTDPCQGTLINVAQANTPGTLSNLCRLTGVPIRFIGSLAEPSAGQINNLSGGNPSLAPEKADTKTLGFVWQPSFARGVTTTIDYWKIDINGYVSSPSTTDVLDGCYNAAFNPGLVFNANCALVGRNPNNGSFNGVAALGVSTPLSNLGFFTTHGFDAFVGYNSLFKDLKMDPKWGRLDIAWNATYTTEYKFKATPSAILRDCLGFYSNACGNIGSSNANSPTKIKWNQRTTWGFGDWVLGYSWRHVGALNVEPGSGTWFPAYQHIKSFDYVDLSASWDVQKNVKLNLTINNAFAKGPPIVGNTIGTTTGNSGNTFPQSYDVIGRFITLGAVIKF